MTKIQKNKGNSNKNSDRVEETILLREKPRLEWTNDERDDFRTTKVKKPPLSNGDEEKEHKELGFYLTSILIKTNVLKIELLIEPKKLPIHGSFVKLRLN